MLLALAMLKCDFTLIQQFELYVLFHGNKYKKQLEGNGEDLIKMAYEVFSGRNLYGLSNRKACEFAIKSIVSISDSFKHIFNIRMSLALSESCS